MSVMKGTVAAAYGQVLQLGMGWKGAVFIFYFAIHSSQCIHYFYDLYRTQSHPTLQFKHQMTHFINQPTFCAPLTLLAIIDDALLFW
jgi:hypothetical protein